MTQTETDDPMLHLADIAERTGRSRNTVDSWRNRGHLPEPDDEIDGRPAWRASTIDQWYAGWRVILRPRRAT